MRIYVAAVAPAAVTIAAAVAQPWVTPARLLRDPIAVLGANDQYYVGAVSHLGVLTLVATAAVVAFMACAPRQVANERAFLALAGLASLGLAIDDLFMLHEYVAPNLFGISERYAFLFYFVGGGGFLIIFRNQILAGETGLCILAVVAMGMSVLADVVETRVPIRFDTHVIYEDGFKLIGYWAWATFFWRRARAGLTAGEAGERSSPGAPA
jgi:hypothetical protein